jgi:glucose-1-phosphatase
MSKSFLAGIDAIIFDLGGVIINLDVSRTINAFATLSGFNHKQIVELTQSEAFFDYERGKISDSTFRDFVKKQLGHDLTDAQIDKAWNAMIIDLPASRIELLRNLNARLSVFVLSNTNNIHIKFVEQQVLSAHRINSFNELVRKDYYSHLMGMRKPEPEIFMRLIEENNLTLNNTLLIDDNQQNIETATLLGFKTYLVPPNQLNLELFK